MQHWQANQTKQQAANKNMARLSELLHLSARKQSENIFYENNMLGALSKFDKDGAKKLQPR